MAVLGPQGQCSTQEYEERREERAKEDELISGSIYAFLGRLAVEELGALKLAVRPEIINKAGRTAVNLTILDFDLQPHHHNRGRMTDGIWTAAPDDPMGIMYEGTPVPFVEGYILDYDDGLGMPTIAAASYKSPRELVGI